MAGKVAFYKCLRSQYEALGSVNPDALYFLIDSKQIYRGEVELTENLIFVSTWVEILNPVPGKFYINTNTGEMRACSEDGMRVVVPPISSSASDFSSVTKRDWLASIGAIKDFVESKIADLDIINNIDFNNSTGSLKVQYEDRVKNVQLKGVAHDPQYSSSSAIIRIPVYGKDDLVIDLPKSNLIKSVRFEPDYPLPDPPGGHGPAIVFTIDQYGVESEMVVPAASLLPPYIGGETNTVKISVDGETYTVSAEVKISDALNNLLAADDHGLYVDGSELAVKNRNIALGEIILSDGNGGFIRSETYISDTELKEHYLATGDIVAQAIQAAVTSAKSELEAKIQGIETRLGTPVEDEVIVGGASNNFVSSGTVIGGSTIASNPLATTLATEAAVAAALPKWAPLDTP